ncbi:uncharacterized protein LOC109609700 isoform X2 [Aethina tumida]|uniref:uncharacterized protein LOC109609700 isoform X2 n=1 Tax=Aethina tumida TaxID=116153 RepID=UPI002148A38D|nr:uncharacterized protein LOC109609700 isoform X2 [Aethina tumida]
MYFKKVPMSDSIYSTNHEFRRSLGEHLLKKERQPSIKQEETSTQTSKTILQLAQLELGDMSPDSLSPKTDQHDPDSPVGSIQAEAYIENLYLPYSRKSQVLDSVNSEETLQESFKQGNTLLQKFLEKRSKHDLKQTDAVNTTNPSTLTTLNLIGTNKLKSSSCVENLSVQNEPERKVRSGHFTLKSVKENFAKADNSFNHFLQQKYTLHINDDRNFNRQRFEVDPNSISFMSPTISSQNKNKMIEIEATQSRISPVRKDNSFGSGKHELQPNIKIPFTDCDVGSTHDSQSLSGSTFREDKLNLSLGDDGYTDLNPTSPKHYLVINQAMHKIRSDDWTASLHGLLEIVEICKKATPESIYPQMTSVNQKLIELLKSSRSHVCRTACQAAGHLFELIGDTRRPEFDEIVDILLCRTADSNKFIRQDANLALDCMVTHISPIHSVRALCSKGPSHKNCLVRLAVARLLICMTVITGVEKIMCPTGNDHTRRRLFMNMYKFICDKHLDTRKMGHRLYMLLSKDRNFETHTKKYLERDEIILMMKNLKIINNK